MAEFVFEGTDEFRHYLEQLPQVAMAAAEPAMQQAILYLHGKLPEYPPELPNQRYQRTNTLGRRWTTMVEVGLESVIGRLGTNVPYAPWVVGPDYPGETINGFEMYQAKIHQGRWWQLEDVIDNNIGGAWTEFEKHFNSEIKRLEEK